MHFISLASTLTFRTVLMSAFLIAGVAIAEPELAARGEGYLGYVKLDVDSVFGSASEDTFEAGGVRLYRREQEANLRKYDRAHFNESSLGLQIIGRSF